MKLPIMQYSPVAAAGNEAIDIGHYPEPVESVLQLCIYFSQFHFIIILPFKA